MEINENLAKLIFEEFDDSIKGADIYNHEGSMWLIFTEERKWVVEFTKQKTLWYNYKHFNDILMLFGMELTEGAEYIKKWYEDKFIFNVVKNDEAWLSHTIVDNVINNGVKETDKSYSNYRLCVEDTIQNGVKHTSTTSHKQDLLIEDTVQNGVKDTMINYADNVVNVEDTIQNGVKNIHCDHNQTLERSFFIEDTIQNGVKEVEYYDGNAEGLVNDAIENGVKEVMDGTMQVFLISDIIKKGVKKVDYQILESMEQKDHLVTTLDFTEKIRDTIENGVKEISSVDCEYPRATINVINNGVKYMMSGSEFKNIQVEDVIKYSEKL